MNKTLAIIKRTLSLLLVISMIFGIATSFTACGGKNNNNNNNNNNSNPNDNCSKGDHVDENDDGSCDDCNESVLVLIDFYAVNDLHGKFCDTEGQPGVDEFGTYMENRRKQDDHLVLLSSGDMWQGSAESNLTRGTLITEWMNALGFVSMTLGNHEFDWGQTAIKNNLEVAEFPFLAINIYDNKTGERVDYCTPSIMIERGGVQIGIIGAIGDCYTSISKDKVEGVHFKTGSELAALVRAEAESLRAKGADLVVFSLHDGYDENVTGEKVISNSNLQKYYTPSLSNGVIDLVFEGHSHRNYTVIDSYGVYHVQGGGENGGISHVEVAVNSANGNNHVTASEYVRTSLYSSLVDHEPTEEIEDKYSDIIDSAYSPLGYVDRYYDDSDIEAIVAELYLEAGLERWDDEYDIVFGGGFIRTRAPYNLYSGDVAYADVLSLLPFDNEIVLCTISGKDLMRRFINNSSSDYYYHLSEYGEDNIYDISNNETYYVVVDTYTAFYNSNGLTIVEYYDYSTYARDLVADAIKRGDI